MKNKDLELFIRKVVKEVLSELINPSPKGWIAENIFHEHKEWIMYEGDDKITTVFDDNSRLSFEVRYPGKWGPEREKWKRKAASRWKSVAREIYNDTGLSEGGNPIVKPWKVCYQEALNSPEMKEFIKKDYAPVFERKEPEIHDDAGYPAEVQGKPSPCMDPVNFTPRA